MHIFCLLSASAFCNQNCTQEHPICICTWILEQETTNNRLQELCCLPNTKWHQQSGEF